MNYNCHPYTKTDLHDNVRSAKERLEPAIEYAEAAIRRLLDFQSLCRGCQDPQTDESLKSICEAAEVAYNAASNAANIGWSGCKPLPVEEVVWRD